MSIPAVSGHLTPAAIDAERRVAVLKKAHDISEAVGQSLVDLVKASTPARSGRIDTYA